MSDVLSQAEIDALLKAMMSGGTPEQEKKECESEDKPAHKVDFKLPRKLKKDDLEKVKKFTEKLVWELSRYYSNKLNTNSGFSIALSAIELLNFADFNNCIKDDSIIYIIDIGSKNNCMYLEMPLVLCSKLNSISKMQPLSSLSAVNTRKILLTGEKICSILEEIFHNNSDDENLHVHLRSMEYVKTFMPSVYYSETVGLLILEVTIGDFTSQLNICMPFNSLNCIISTFNPDIIEDTIDFEYLRDMGVDLEFMLGRSQINLKDFESLRVGDVILLNSRVKDSNIEVVAGDSLLYHGKLGANENRYVVKISEKR